MNRWQRTVGISLLGDDKTRIHENGLAKRRHKDRQLFYQANVCKWKANVGWSFGGPIGKTGLSKFKTGRKKAATIPADTSRAVITQYKTVIGRNQAW